MCVSSSNSSSVSSLAASPTSAWSTGLVRSWVGMICGATLLLNSGPIFYPHVVIDDFQILIGSWAWQDARANLWLPHNEHSMPLGRLSTWLLVQIAGRPTLVPVALALQGPLALVAAVLLVYIFVRRETGQPVPAVLAMALFGVNTHYQNAVNWFSASFAVLALDTFLLGMLAAQRWRQTGRTRHLALSALWCALAPGWFATGVLAGPLTTLYLLAWAPRKPKWPRRVWLAPLTPFLGTLVSLTLTLTVNGNRILGLPRVEVQATAWDTFDPITGTIYTMRSMIDDLVPGALGFEELTSPLPVVVAGWLVLGLAGVWCWRQALNRPLLLLGLGLIVASYVLIYSGRAYFEYEGMHHWGRYHLLSHLGLVLFACGGLPGRFVQAVNVASARAVNLGSASLLGLLIVTQFPRVRTVGYDPQQSADLERVERVDALCRQHRIDAVTAREALPPFEISGMEGREIDGRRLSGWDLLRGSPNPQRMTVAEARRMLEADLNGSD